MSVEAVQRVREILATVKPLAAECYYVMGAAVG
jgi:hypothetical protein